MAGDFTGGLDDLLHREPLAISKIVRAAALLQRSEGKDVGLCQVADMDIIPHAGAIGRGVVVAEDADVLALAEGNLEHQRNEMQLGIMILSPFLAGAGGIEITQAGGFHPVRLLQPVQGAFHDELALAIRTARDDALVLRNGHALGLVKEVGGGGQDEFLHPVVAHGLHEIETIVRVFLEILEGLLHGLAHERVGGKVHHGLRLVFGDGGADFRFDRQITPHEYSLGMHGGAMPLIEIVKHHDFMSLRDEVFRGDAADVSGSTCNEHFHENSDRRTGFLVFWWIAR